MPVGTEPARRRRLSGFAVGEVDFEALAESSPSLIFVTDSRGRCLYTNRRFQDFTGLPADALIGDGWLQVIHPDDHGAARDNKAVALVTGEPFEGECRHRAADGTYAWFMVRCCPVREGGEVVRWVGHCWDINDRKLAEEVGVRASPAFQVNETRLRRLVESGIVGVGFGRRDGSVSYANDAFLRMVGRTRDDLEQGCIDWRELTAPEYWPLDEAAIAEMLRDGTCRPYVKEYVLPGGRLPVQVTMALLNPADPEAEHVAVIKDISERRRAENALHDRAAEVRRLQTRLQVERRQRQAAQDALLQSQKLEALGQLTSGIAHDFNNLLAAIGGSFRLIERRVTDPRVLSILQHGLTAAQRGEALVKRLMAFARQRSLAVEPTDLCGLIAEFEPMLRQTVGTRVAVEIDCPPSLWPVRVDPAQLESALINLSANARDAMAGTGKLTLSVRDQPALTPGHPAELVGADAVVITLTDTGAGMPPDVLQRVVEPFFTTKAQGKGTGLGLAMVHGFVQSAGGALRLESRVGQGTTVVIYLPRSLDSAPDSARALQAELAVKMQSGDGRSVMLVEDDPEVRAVTAAQLRDLGYKVIEAEDGAIALMILLRGVQPVDIVLCDMAMPNTDGRSFVATMRRDLPTLPVLFMTGDDHQVSQAGEAVIAKPFLPQELASRLSALLQTSGEPASQTDEVLDRVAARLRSDSLKVLLRRWRAARMGGRLPLLAEFDTMTNGRPHPVAVIEVDMGRVPIEFRILQADETLEHAAGRALGGTDIEVIGEQFLPAIEAAYQRCAKSMLPTYEYARFALDEDEPALFERLLLPFGDEAGMVNRLVSAVVVSGTAARLVGKAGSDDTRG